MSLITIFSTPKAFTKEPHINVIQRNAIKSWTMLGEAAEVILVGNDPGTAETAEEFGVKHLPQAACNEKGTPLVSSIFELARTHSSSPLLCYVNADIILFPDIISAGEQMLRLADKFLVVGQRYDLDITAEYDFPADWVEILKEKMTADGKLHAQTGSDYFLFPRDVFTNIPEFAIGRAGWDNWMIFEAMQNGWLVADGTPSVDIIHQNHDYRHLAGGKPHYKQPESQVNQALGGGEENMYLLLDANKILDSGRLINPKPTLTRLLRKIERILEQYKNIKGIRKLWRIVRRKRKRMMHGL